MNMFIKRFVAILIDVIIIGAASFILGKVAGILSIVLIAYEPACLVLMQGQTLGKKVMGLRVTPVPGWGTAIVRTLMKIVSALPLYLGFFWMLWDKKGQTWHDKVANTNVK